MPGTALILVTACGIAYREMLQGWTRQPGRSWDATQCRPMPYTQYPTGPPPGRYLSKGHWGQRGSCASSETGLVPEQCS